MASWRPQKGKPKRNYESYRAFLLPLDLTPINPTCTGMGTRYRFLPGKEVARVRARSKYILG